MIKSKENMKDSNIFLMSSVLLITAAAQFSFKIKV